MHEWVERKVMNYSPSSIVTMEELNVTLFNIGPVGTEIKGNLVPENSLRYSDTAYSTFLKYSLWQSCTVFYCR